MHTFSLKPTTVQTCAEDIGKCGSECKTIQRAAEDIVGDHDTDIAEKLWKVCSQHASVCKVLSLQRCLLQGVWWGRQPADTGMGKGCPKSCENCRDLLCQTSPYGVYSCMGAFANFMPCVAGHIRSLGKYRQNCCWTLMHAPTHHSNNLEAAMQGSQSRAQFSNWLCYELTPSCKKKPPPCPRTGGMLSCLTLWLGLLCNSAALDGRRSRCAGSRALDLMQLTRRRRRCRRCWQA